MHEHWSVNPDDPDDRTLTGVTVVIRESAWDDESRDAAVDLIEFEEGFCTCGCGLPRSVAHTEQPFMVHDYVCWAGKAIAEVQDRDRTKHEQTKDVDAHMRGRHYFAVPAKAPEQEADPDQ